MRRMGRGLFACLLAGLVFTASPAQAESSRFELSAFGAYRDGGEFDVNDPETGGERSIDLENGAGWGAAVHIYRDPWSYYEFFFSTQDADLDPDALGGRRLEVTTEYYHLGGTLLFDVEPWLRPYLSLTVGLTRFKADGYDTENDPSGSLALGLRFPVGEHVSFDLGLRGYGTLVDSNTGFFCASGGGEAVCLLETSGNAVFQAEASAGIAVRF